MKTYQKKLSYYLLGFVLLGALGACSENNTKGGRQNQNFDNTNIPAFAWVTDLAGPATGNDAFSSLSFNYPIPVLSKEDLDLHMAGDREFSRQFTSEQGLGPAFNASSCTICHARDGRGALPLIPKGQSSVLFGPNESLLLRVILKTENGYESVPRYSPQVHQRGIYGLRDDKPGLGQTDIEMSFSYSTFTYPDGSQVQLRTPKFNFINPYDETVEKPSALRDPRLRISARVGAPVFGLGLFDAVDDETFIRLASPSEKNQDGVFGKVNIVNGRVGRHGWKANAESVLSQISGALNQDMGLTSSILPNENILGTDLFNSWLKKLGINSGANNYQQVDISDQQLKEIAFYAATLSVPKRRDVMNPSVLSGATHFQKIGCTACHTPQLKTGTNGTIDYFKNQTFYPFTDGLLHDMGEGLADDRPDYLASGREWKTRPLWGIGLTQTVNPRAGFLHDGRAATLEEAILHHGGEAETAKMRFANLNKSARNELISFLKSL